MPEPSRPFVSIVVPFKGTSSGLARLSAALARQTYPRDRMEVIVVDDASEVRVAAACATLAASGPAPTVITNRVTLGRARSRNLGAAAACGEILVFIDSDDVPTPDYVDRIAARLSAVGPRVALRTNMRVHEDLTRRSHFARFQDSRHVGSRIAAGRFVFDAGALPPKFVSTASLGLWKQDFDTLGGFDETFVAYGGEDEEFGLRMQAAGMTVAFAPDALIWDGDGTTSLDRLCARIPEYVQVGLRRVVEKYPEYVRLSRYARLAFSDDGGTTALIAGLVTLRRLGAIAAVRWALTRIDGVVDLRVPHHLYELVIAAEVAAARVRGRAVPRPPCLGKTPCREGDAIKLLVCTEYFWPDRASTGRLMGELSAALKAAHPHWEIEVLTGPRAYRGDGGVLPRQESWHGIDIRRLHTFRRRGADPLWWRAFSDLAFSLQVAWHVARSRCDVVLAVTNPPIMPIVAAVAALLRRPRTVYLIHDLYPDVPVALGMWRPASVPAAVLRRAQGFAMRRASRIVVLGESMRAYLARQYGVDPARVAVIPNWATISTPGEDRGMEEHAEEFVVMYAGNLGRLHDFETVLDAAGLLQNEPAVRFVIAGDGARAAWLHREVGRRRLSNVMLRSFLPDGEFEALLRTASLGIVTLEPGMEPLGVPSKTYNLLAAGVPLLAITGDESEVARLIRARHVGYRVTHGDARGFASIVSRLQRDREHWRALSANARAGAAEARVEVAAGRYAREIVGATAPAVG